MSFLYKAATTAAAVTTAAATAVTVSQLKASQPASKAPANSSFWMGKGFISSQSSQLVNTMFSKKAQNDQDYTASYPGSIYKFRK